MLRLNLATTATLAVLAAGLLVPMRAEAMTAPVTTELQATLADANLTQNIAYICRRVWRCGRYGCGWRRVCWWAHRHPYWRYGYRRYWW